MPLLYAVPFRLLLASLKLELLIATADSHSVIPVSYQRYMAQSYTRDSNSQRIPPDPSSMSLTLASSVATSRNTLVPLTLGCSANAIELLVLTAPADFDLTPEAE